MTFDLETTIRELKDRQDIYDCMMRYCRGVDRLDRELLLSCYHPDAFDDHGVYVGPASGFIDWVLKIYGDHKHVSHHEITNHYVELFGDTAYAESYWISTSVDVAEPHYSMARGRYVDRLERRDGRWAIAHRACLVEISPLTLPAQVAQLARTMQPRDRTDLSYRRAPADTAQS